MTDEVRAPALRPRPSGRVAVMAGVLALTAGTLGVSIGGSPTASAVTDDDWLGIVNTYRAMSGLDPVVENSTWSSQALSHSCYMLQNGITHDETPGSPGYTSGGDTAGNNGNVAVSSAVTAEARDHIDLWMTGPFHAIGILRPNLTSSGFGLCTSSETPTWHSAGTLDVLRGLDPDVAEPGSPVVFPGEGATVPLTRFITEYPNPMTMCGWSGDAGLPLIALMPDDIDWADAALTGPNGPIPTCALHESNTTDPTARSILDGDNAVVVMPREVLADGSYTATVNSSAGSVSWTFNIDHDAPLDITPPDLPDAEVPDETTGFEPIAQYRAVDTRTGHNAVRLRAGKITPIEIADPDVVAVSANFVVIDPADHGYLTAYSCATNVPTVSTIGYSPHEVVANQAIVPLQNGKLCLYSLRSVDVAIDVNGHYVDGGGSGFTPVAPTRIHSTYTSGGKVRSGQVRSVSVAGDDGPAPAGANAVALNVTVADTASYGYVQVFPCGSPTAAEISTINYKPKDYRPNSVVTPIDDQGRICFTTTASSHVLFDFVGYFGNDEGFEFVSVDPMRLFDSRSRYAELNSVTGGNKLRRGNVARIEIAGVRGVPDDAKAVSLNITATQAERPTYLTAYPCGTLPDTSNVNLVPWQPASANGAMVKLSTKGEICVYTLDDVHLVIDLNGVWR